MLKKEKAVQIMENLCKDDSHGYSQTNRWGLDYDCSSAIITAFEQAGINVGKASYTGNMRSEFTRSGNFVWHPMSSGYTAQRGDVYLNEVNHTAMCTSAVPDMLAEFCISETGGITGQPGDQTGREAYVHGYYDYPWDGILECINNEDAGGNSQPASTPPKPQPTPTSNINVSYAIMMEGGEKTPFVNSGQEVGKQGKKIVGFACKVSQGSVKYRAHLIGKGWFEYATGCDFNDFENGFAGDGKTPIDLIEVYLYSPNGDKSMMYQVAPINQGYFPVQCDSDINAEMDGFAGDYNMAIDRIKMWVE